MKTSIIITIVFLIASCDKREDAIHTESIAVSSIVDITDIHSLLPDVQAILELYHMEINKDEAVVYRNTYTTDKAYNPVEVCSLRSNAQTDEENTTDDIFHREKCVLEFYEGVRKIIKESNNEAMHDTTLSKSECFKAISKEATVLARLPHTRKYLLIYSDLAENSSLLNSYRLGTDNQEASIKRTVKVLSQTHLMPKTLAGITVLIIYQPKNRDDDTRYQIMSEVYRRILEERGAIVIITTNPKHLQP